MPYQGISHPAVAHQKWFEIDTECPLYRLLLPLVLGSSTSAGMQPAASHFAKQAHR
jgi:hypothetical protein